MTTPQEQRVVETDAELSGVEAVLLDLVREGIGDTDKFLHYPDKLLNVVRVVGKSQFTNGVLQRLNQSSEHILGPHLGQYFNIPVLPSEQNPLEKIRHHIAKGYGEAATNYIIAAMVIQQQRGYGGYFEAARAVNSAAMALKYAGSFRVYPMIPENVATIIQKAKETGAINLEILVSEASHVLSAVKSPLSDEESLAKLLKEYAATPPNKS